MKDSAETVIGREPVLLRDGLTIGREPGSDLLLPNPSVSRRHAAVRQSGAGWRVEDLGSRSGSYLNGRLFQNEELVLGDVLQFGPFYFRYDGKSLREALALSGAALAAEGLKKTVSGHRLLDEVSFAVAPCQFVGIIGPSGAGKSTLLDALCGLRPADSGAVRIDGLDLYQNYEALREHLGYVPQEDIVPVELDVETALTSSARLRLPAGTPPPEIHKLVARTMENLGLAARAKTAVGKLSGGQRKRVSVGVELLGRPRLLFLDEPTSGLDPAAEFRLMESLRQLAATGCTILCTTHVMENAYLMDRLAIISGGRLVYFGEPAGACAHFDVERLSLLYDRLEERADWPRAEPAPAAAAAAPLPPPQAHRRPWAPPLLLLRQWAVLRADRKNLALLLAQPVLIGLLVTWVSRDPGLVLFFAYIATLWFGCGNAAQEIVKEIPMLRRERLIGLGRHEYLLAKFLSLTALTMLQSLLLYGIMQLGARGIPGSPAWQIAGLLAAAGAAVGIGLAISAWARSVLQAVMLVPLVLIPQILFSGFSPPAGEMKSGPYAVSLFLPSAAAQRVMDVSLFWNQTISGAMRVDFPTAFSNLNRDRSLKNGRVFRQEFPARSGLATLAAWTIASYLAAFFLLRTKERG